MEGIKIVTGLSGSVAPTELYVTYERNGTTVAFAGEHQSSEPVEFAGLWSPEQVRAWYLMQMAVIS